MNLSIFCVDNFYSSSDSDSEDDNVDKKIFVEIKPLNHNGTAPISASVDELRQTIEGFSLSPVGALSVSLCSFNG
jgi:F-BAR domain only protein